MQTAPAVGTFLLPVSTIGRLCYCLRVDAITPAHRGEWGDEPEHWDCTRFGLNEAGQPCDDGHITPGYSITAARHVAPGVWRAEKHPWRGLFYYRSIAAPVIQRRARPMAQLDLFAA